MTIIAVYGNDEKSRKVAIALEILLSGVLSSTEVVYNHISDDMNLLEKEKVEETLRNELIETEFLETLDDEHADVPIEITFRKVP